MNPCNRCGRCCMSLPSWNELNDEKRALIRMFDPSAEMVFNGVRHGNCPNLTFVERMATCSIYPTRPRFCREFPKSEVTIPECFMTKPTMKKVKA
jgi:Fe-S-cluster containining protein